MESNISLLVTDKIGDRVYEIQGPKSIDFVYALEYESTVIIQSDSLKRINLSSKEYASCIGKLIIIGKQVSEITINAQNLSIKSLDLNGLDTKELSIDGTLLKSLNNLWLNKSLEGIILKNLPELRDIIFASNSNIKSFEAYNVGMSRLTFETSFPENLETLHLNKMPNLAILRVEHGTGIKSLSITETPKLNYFQLFDTRPELMPKYACRVLQENNAKNVIIGQSLHKETEMYILNDEFYLQNGKISKK